MMDARLKQVTQIPLKELCHATGSIIGSRIRMLKRTEIAELLRTGAIEFVVADVGRPLDWIDPHDCFSFWKNEVKSHLADAGSQIEPENFPGAYCYAASQWVCEEIARPIVLLERYH